MKIPETLYRALFFSGVESPKRSRTATVDSQPQNSNYLASDTVENSGDTILEQLKQIVNTFMDAVEEYRGRDGQNSGQGLNDGINQMQGQAGSEIVSTATGNDSMQVEAESPPLYTKSIPVALSEKASRRAGDEAQGEDYALATDDGKRNGVKGMPAEVARSVTEKIKGSVESFTVEAKYGAAMQPTFSDDQGRFKPGRSLSNDVPSQSDQSLLHGFSGKVEGAERSLIARETDKLMRFASSIGYKLHLSGIPGSVTRALEDVVQNRQGKASQPRLVLLSDKSAQGEAASFPPEAAGHGQFYVPGPSSLRFSGQTYTEVNKGAALTVVEGGNGKPAMIEAVEKILTDGKNDVRATARSEGIGSAASSQAPIVSGIVEAGAGPKQDKAVTASGPAAGSEKAGISAEGSVFSDETTGATKGNLSSTGFGTMQSMVAESAVQSISKPEEDALLKGLARFVREVNDILAEVSNYSNMSADASGRAIRTDKYEIPRSLAGNMASIPNFQTLARKIINGYEQFQEVETLGLSLGKDGILRLDATLMASQLSSKKEETLGTLKDFGSMLSERINYFANPFVGIYIDDKNVLRLKATQKDESASLLNKELSEKQGQFEKKLKKLQVLIDRSLLLKAWFRGNEEASHEDDETVITS